jgi:hypothetical protein
MKLLCFLTALALSATAFTTMAEEQSIDSSSSATQTVAATPHRYYLEIQGIQNPLNVKAFEIKLIAGEIFCGYSKVSEKDLRTFVSTFQFRSMIDALNLLSQYGWQLSECYTSAISGNVFTNWIIYKDVTTPEELAFGLTQKK